MKEAINYLNEAIGLKTIENSISNKFLGNLPIFITQAYKLYNANIFDRNVVFAEQINENDFSVLQTVKHLQLIKNKLEKPIILVVRNLLSYNRKRFIQNKINFIVPDKQIFLPELLINLSENYSTEKIYKNKNIMPSAQFLLLYHLLHKDNNWRLEDHSFKEIAEKLDYSPMAISNAADELKSHNIIEVKGEKEKFIRFNFQRKKLWDLTQEQNLLDTPVLKTIYVDELPQNIFMMKANVSALSQYTNLNPDRQQYFAIERNKFYELQKNNIFKDVNDKEGQFAIEVWKYNPKVLSKNDNKVVDPLSLYLSLKNNYDERIEMGLEQIIEKMIW